jgi:hypothetical protein
MRICIWFCKHANKRYMHALILQDNQRPKAESVVLICMSCTCLHCSTHSCEHVSLNLVKLLSARACFLSMHTCVLRRHTSSRIQHTQTSITTVTVTMTLTATVTVTAAATEAPGAAGAGGTSSAEAGGATTKASAAAVGLPDEFGGAFGTPVGGGTVCPAGCVCVCVCVWIWQQLFRPASSFLFLCIHVMSA